MKLTKHINPDGSELQVWRGAGVRLGAGVSLGDWVSLGAGVRLGDWVSLGAGVSLGDGVNVPDGLNGLTFQMTFYPMTVSGDVITSGCHTKTPEEWLKYMTRDNCRREGLKDHYRPFYIDFVKTVIRLMEEQKGGK